MIKTQANEFYAPSIKIWRSWLKHNGENEKNVWLIIYKKQSGTPSVTYIEAVEEALCFGWIDSKGVKRDENSYLQFFSKRNPKSNWSAVNKKRVEKLIAQKRMTKAGLKMIQLAKDNGRWNVLDMISELVLPDDLKKTLSKNKKAQKNFDAFPPSAKKGIFEWIINAKREETRSKRIVETVRLAALNLRANQYMPKDK